MKNICWKNGIHATEMQEKTHCFKKYIWWKNGIHATEMQKKNTLFQIVYLLKEWYPCYRNAKKKQTVSNSIFVERMVSMLQKCKKKLFQIVYLTRSFCFISENFRDFCCINEDISAIYIYIYISLYISEDISATGTQNIFHWSIQITKYFPHVILSTKYIQ